MGPLGNLMKMVPGMGKAMQGMGQVDERELDRLEAIIQSMTPLRAGPPEPRSTVRAASGSRTAPGPRSRPSTASSSSSAR